MQKIVGLTSMDTNQLSNRIMVAPGKRCSCNVQGLQSCVCVLVDYTIFVNNVSVNQLFSDSGYRF